MIAEIIVDIDSNQVNRPFDYQIPTFLEGVIEVGCRVIVPFGPRKLMGFVFNIKECSDYNRNIKEIIDIIDLKKPLNKEFMELAFFMSNHYFSFYSTVLNAMIPSALKIKYQKKITVKNIDKVSDNLKSLLNRKNEAIINDTTKLYLREINSLIKTNDIIIENILKKRKNDKLKKFLIINDLDGKVRSKKGRELLDYLIEVGEIDLDFIKDELGFSDSVIKTLVTDNVIAIIEKEIENEKKIAYENNSIIKVNFTDEQTICYNKITKSFNHSKTFLLSGITGSGKTEIYLKVIEDIVALNKEAIMLVPEISLTPQMEGRFKERFGDNVAIIHSRLSISEKYSEWKKIIDKTVKIVLGARSAIFAPFENLGAIIIDEEHESSYRQDNNPKYDAITVAEKRSEYHKCPLILGSATPRVIDYYKALNSEYELLELKKRPGLSILPKSEIVDMRMELKSGNKSVISRPLAIKIKETFLAERQSILFINRRGYSSFVMCRDCGSTINCPHCDISLTYHKQSNRLKCHSCGHEIVNPVTCPKCNSNKIKFVGTGTQKIEEEVRNILPEARIIRMDYDTTRQKDSYGKIYDGFYNHHADILIGTQMVAKGFDFPLVSLVGVINADLALNYPSYDSYEMCYNLIEQVSGRAGRRDFASEVIIQTYSPDNYAIKAAKNHDYNNFYDEEIKKRKLSIYPPFSSLIEVIVSSTNLMSAKNEADKLAFNLRKNGNDTKIYGPTEAQIFKLNDHFRFSIYIKETDESVEETLRYAIKENQSENDVYINITRM